MYTPIVGNSKNFFNGGLPSYTDTSDMTAVKTVSVVLIASVTIGLIAAVALAAITTAAIAGIAILPAIFVGLFATLAVSVITMTIASVAKLILINKAENRNQERSSENDSDGYTCHEVHQRNSISNSASSSEESSPHTEESSPHTEESSPHTEDDITAPATPGPPSEEETPSEVTAKPLSETLFLNELQTHLRRRKKKKESQALANLTRIASDRPVVANIAPKKIPLNVAAQIGVVKVKTPEEKLKEIQKLKDRMRLDIFTQLRTEIRKEKNFEFLPCFRGAMYMKAKICKNNNIIVTIDANHKFKISFSEAKIVFRHIDKKEESTYKKVSIDELSAFELGCLQGLFNKVDPLASVSVTRDNLKNPKELFKKPDGEPLVGCVNAKVDHI